jgi:hypothetical protein
MNQKKGGGEVLVFFVARSYLTHGPFNNMQIVRSNSNGRFKTNIPHQHNLLLYSEG